MIGGEDPKDEEAQKYIDNLVKEVREVFANKGELLVLYKDTVTERCKGVFASSNMGELAELIAAFLLEHRMILDKLEKALLVLALSELKEMLPIVTPKEVN